MTELNRTSSATCQGNDKSEWLADCSEQRKSWQELKVKRVGTPSLFDEYWQQEVLTQPAAIMTALEWAKANNAVSFFDAGDVQANGFQLVEDEEPG